MKKTIITGAVALALGAPTYAELEGDLSLDYASEYSFRGNTDLFSEAFNTDDATTAEINATYALNDQFSIVVGASITTLGNSGFDHDRYRGGILWKNDCCSVELGYQYHDITAGGFLVAGQGSDTEEIYLDFRTKCPLTGGNLRLFVAHDIDLLDGTYADLSVNKAWDLCEKVKLDVTVGASYSFDYWDNVYATGDDWNHAYLRVALPIQLTDNLVVTPYAVFSQGFDALDPAGNTEESDEIVVGIKASVKF